MQEYEDAAKSAEKRDGPPRKCLRAAAPRAARATIRSAGFAFYDVTADGQRFIMVQKDPIELRPIELVLVPNWLEELKARMASAR